MFDYDNNGNITTKRQTTFTLRDNVEECDFEVFEYVYEGDRLISYNGEQCEYNGLGSPTTYRGKTLNWRYGKILLGYGDVSFSYDGLGRRLSKSAGFTSINYYYDNDGDLIKHSYGLEFVYDNGGVTGFKHGGENYFYRKDAQGNIAAILDSAGEIVVRYHYDVWGNHEVLDENGAEITDKNHIGNLNPFRYRGYYYDTETDLYYLQTRYYDPETGRFISQDSIEYADPECINGLNLYAYCGNNPVMFTDETGTMPNWLKWLLGGLAFVGAVVLTALTGGALAPVFIGMAVSIVSSAIIQGVVTAVNGGSFWQGFLDGAADGALWGGIFALGGAVVRTGKILTKGIVVGENMTRVTKYANSTGQAVYKGMPGYKVVKFFKGTAVADNLAMAHNKAFINRMMKWGVKITDIGMDIFKSTRSQFYMMEASSLVSYWNLFKNFMWH